MKKSIIITPFFNYSYNVRIKLIENILTNSGYEVIIVTSDFDHRSKQKYYVDKANVVQIKTIPYLKNLSLKRMKSHIRFAIDSIKTSISYNPDVVYISGPPNSLFKYSKLLKKRCDSKIIFEIGDMWPETLPSNGFAAKLASPLLLLWKNFRNKNLWLADYVVFECDLFREKLKKHCLNSGTVYLSKNDELCQRFLNDCPVDSNTLNFLYIGSLNNIVDYDLIINYLLRVKKYKKVKLYIIGGGEKKDLFLKQLAENEVDYDYKGMIFDEREKSQIALKCQFAFNVMKESVFVGATMKSLDYFNYGLVLVNNIMGDSSKIIEEYNCGFNILTAEGFDFAVEKIGTMTEQEISIIKTNSRRVFLELFDEKIVQKKITNIIRDICN